MLVASLRAGAGCFCLPFVATLPNTVLFPSTLAVDGAPPHPALPDIALYLRRLRERVAVWCVGGSQRCRTPAAGPRNRWDWNHPPLRLPAHPQAHRGPPRVRLLSICRATRPSRGEGTSGGGNGRLSWSAVLAFEAPLPPCLSRAPWTLQDDNSHYAHVLDEHARGELGQGLGECWASLGSVTTTRTHPHPTSASLRSALVCSSFVVIFV